MRLPRLLTPSTVVSAHCDLPCGVYDPAQARIEATSVLAMQKKAAAKPDDERYQERAQIIIHERAGLAKHHLAVLWHDYFKPEHFEKYPQLHDLINKTIKAGSGTGARGSLDPATGQALLDGIDEIARIFWETKGKEYAVPQSADQA
jgi:nickel superoxide dismutase